MDNEQFARTIRAIDRCAEARVRAAIERTRLLDDLKAAEEMEATPATFYQNIGFVVDNNEKTAG